MPYRSAGYQVLFDRANQNHICVFLINVDLTPIDGPNLSAGLELHDAEFLSRYGIDLFGIVEDVALF